jgi:hypothetical protein
MSGRVPSDLVQSSLSGHIESTQIASDPVGSGPVTSSLSSLILSDRIGSGLVESSLSCPVTSNPVVSIRVGSSRVRSVESGRLTSNHVRSSRVVSVESDLVNSVQVKLRQVGSVESVESKVPRSLVPPFEDRSFRTTTSYGRGTRNLFQGACSVRGRGGGVDPLFSSALPDNRRDAAGGPRRREISPKEVSLTSREGKTIALRGAQNVEEIGHVSKRK